MVKIENEMNRMTKKEFMDMYEKYKDIKDLAVTLYIHMPDDSIEIINNSQGHNKVKYIDNTYDENLVHKNSDKIYIIYAEMQPKNMETFGFDFALNMILIGKKVSRKAWDNDEVYIYFMNDNESIQKEESIAYKTKYGLTTKYVAIQKDLLAKDWYIVE